MRKSLLGLAGVFVAAGVAVAGKPSSVPAHPHVEGREPTPIAREFHQPDAPPPAKNSGGERQQRPSEDQVRRGSEVLPGGAVPAP